ncbi:hypothetical protein HZH66_000120 [Vespula vulgaris]|uniref:Uncharacterized protein n=1 Tax=Vespula vulgaris TaxID=7454 RepID=A0A834KTW8_VESVU|nr:hypothetical protein HZH66_000120 [Vespula vulgaris]
MQANFVNRKIDESKSAFTFMNFINPTIQTIHTNYTHMRGRATIKAISLLESAFSGLNEGDTKKIRACYELNITKLT